jgi:hypothetical protein
MNRYLKNDYEEIDPPVKKYPAISCATAVVFAISICVTVISLIGITTAKTAFQTSQFVTTGATGATKAIEFTTKRDGYEPLDFFLPDTSDLYQYNFLTTHAGIVEPYTTMWVHLINAATETSTYSICQTMSSADAQDCVTGDTQTTPFTLACTPHEDQYTITITQNAQQTTATLLCMYVRREFRTLSTTDRDATIEAMWKLWEYDEEAGRHTYGENFHSYSYLLDFHYFNAAWIHSDHIHEGNGFLAQHVKMTNIFEAAMQAVDPSTTLPYWDYTIETADGIQTYESPLFTEKTFGSLPLPANMTWGWLYESNELDDGKIPDGKWANFKIATNTKFDDLEYAYGYMRAPWNINPSTYITRYTATDKTFPTCKSHYDLLGYTELSDFLQEIPYAAHASTHGVIGGSFGCDVLNSMREAGYITSVEGQLNICQNWIFYMKEFYRSAILLPQSECTADAVTTDTSTCVYICNDARKSTLLEMLQHSIMNSGMEAIPPYGEMPDEGWTAWTEFICGGEGSKIYAGDHLESASPADPSFWPIHPTLERVFQAKLMAGGFADSDTWPTDPVTEYVCNKAVCYEEDEQSFGNWDTCCYGHYENDQMLDAPNNDRYTYVGPTNKDVHDGTNPTNPQYSMKYIYDTFTWSHCIQEGYDFDALLQEQYLR